MIHKVISGMELLKVLCPALNIEFNTVVRVVIDVNYNDAVVIYVQRVGDERLLKLDWPALLKDADIRFDKDDKK